MAPRILIFSIAMGADYSFYVKFIATGAPTFFGHTISVLASVKYIQAKEYLRANLSNIYSVDRSLSIAES